MTQKNKGKKGYLTTHHTIPKSKNGSNESINLILLTSTVHQALHTLFDNKLPHEQIIKILELNEKVFTSRFIEEMEKLINEQRSIIYKDNVFWQ